MLTVITGLPGSGKTSKVIEAFLMPLAKNEWKEKAIDDEGNEVIVVRKLHTNINGLLLEHEKIDADDLLRWQEWVKPGDLIVFDEVQKPWPLTGANKEQPKCITELETHRHYGIDMMLLTQHPMLINAAIVRLAGQHLHIRKLGNSRFATVYEWDGVSRTLLYKNAFAKKAWRRGKEVEKVYRSSALHTKQKRALPSVLFGVIFAVVLGFFLGPTVYGRISDRMAGVKPQDAKPAQHAKADQMSRPMQRTPENAPRPVPVAAATPAEPASSAPKLAQIGCIRSAKSCKCFDPVGAVVDKEPEFCEDHTGKNVPAKLATVVSGQWEPPRAAVQLADLEMIRQSEQLIDQRKVGQYVSLYQGGGR